MVGRGCRVPTPWQHNCPECGEPHGTLSGQLDDFPRACVQEVRGASVSVTPAFAVIGDLWAGCTCCRRFVEGGEGKECVGEGGEEGRR